MKRNASATVVLLLTAGVFLACPAASAQDAGSKDSGYYPVALGVGESFDVCASGAVVCPASIPICDDTKVVTAVDLPGGLGFKGVAPGTTLCSAASATGPRRVFRITVR
jgi:hypothetical protein